MSDNGCDFAPFFRGRFSAPGFGRKIIDEVLIDLIVGVES
jgi:hypothetical protein